MKHKRNKNGFTIIEVVLALAIAGLIFLMVFIALPALQRSQRDTQRKNDVALVVTALNNWKANNRGKSYVNLGQSEFTPTTVEGGGDNKWNSAQNLKSSPLAKYINVNENGENNTSDSVISKNIESITTHVLPSDRNRSSINLTGTNRFTVSKQIMVNVNTTCEVDSENESRILYRKSPGKATVIVKLESGGVYCQET